MNNKTFSIISYITIIGWLLAYYIQKETTDNFRRFHLKQSLGLAIATFAADIILNLLVPIGSVLIPLSALVGAALLVLLIIGVLNAAKGEQKLLPLIGKISAEKINFL